jgi:hypothetical protein
MKFFLVVVPVALLLGCSTHPLPENVIELSVYDIVHKVQCEAAATVKEIHSLSGYTQASLELARLNAQIEGATKQVARLQGELESNNDFGTRENELAEALLAIDLRLQKFGEQAEAIEKSVLSYAAKVQKAQTLVAEQKYLKAQFEKVGELAEKLDEVSTAAKELGRLRAKLSVPLLKEVADFEGNKATFQFVFQIQEDDGSGVKGSIVWPVALGTFTLGYDVGDKRTRFSDRKVTIVATFGELNYLSCSDVDYLTVNRERDQRAFRRYPMQGNIGLAEVLQEYMRVRDEGKLKSTGEVYSDKIQFTTTVNAVLSPSVSLTRSFGQRITADASLVASRKDIHELTLSIAPKGVADTAGAQKVVITQMPAIRIRPSMIRPPPE